MKKLNEGVGLDAHWLECIDDATACLHQNTHYDKNGKPNNEDDDDPRLVVLNHSLLYLRYLQDCLKAKTDHSPKPGVAVLEGTDQEEHDLSKPVPFAVYAGHTSPKHDRDNIVKKPATKTKQSKQQNKPRATSNETKPFQFMLVPSQITSSNILSNKPRPPVPFFQPQGGSGGVEASPYRNASYNPFATLAFSDDEEEDDDEDDDNKKDTFNQDAGAAATSTATFAAAVNATVTAATTSNTINDAAAATAADDEAGDVVIPMQQLDMNAATDQEKEPNAAPNNQETTTDETSTESTMTIRRLLIRISTAQSDLMVRKASVVSQIVMAEMKRVLAAISGRGGYGDDGNDDYSVSESFSNNENMSVSEQSTSTSPRYNSNKSSSGKKKWSWYDIATFYTTALAHTRFSLGLADVQISTWLAERFQKEQEREQLRMIGLEAIAANGSSVSQQQPGDEEKERKLQYDRLVQDASIVQVCIASLIKSCDKYTHMAENRKAWLENKLRPQWESRDEVKERWGADRWKNNPAPKYTYAKQRAVFERLYKDIERALEALEKDDVHELEGMYATQIQGKLDAI